MVAYDDGDSDCFLPSNRVRVPRGGDGAPAPDLVGAEVLDGLVALSMQGAEVS